MFFENSFAQQNLSPHQQWKKFTDPNTLTCKQGFVLLQKSNGFPACVTPYTYLKLIDRGYGSYDLTSISKHPDMLNQMTHYMVSNEKLMLHWHEMMLKNKDLMNKTIDDWISQMKDDSTLLKNTLGPMTSDPELREHLIQIMKNHPTMEISLLQSSIRMESIHMPITNSGIKHNRDSLNNCHVCSNMHEKILTSSCSWCPYYEKQQVDKHHEDFSNSEKIMEILHSMWANSQASKEIHDVMIEDTSHMAQMSDELMEPLLNAIMNDETLRNQMIHLMLNHDDFMNSIRHENPSQIH